MNVYYWKEKKNFGDLLTSLLLKRFARLDSVWTPPEQAQLVMVGSILEHLPDNWSGIVAGAGKLHASRMFLPKAKFLAVRGPLTARVLGIKEKIVYADPGLLADELVPIADKEYDLGIIPHWTDTKLEHNAIFKQFKPKIIRVSDDPLKVISEIGKCKKIVSSSLHGIILADAFNIPRRIEIPPRTISHPHQEGGLFKWLDYSRSLNMELKVGVTEEADKNLIQDKQNEMFDVFEKISKIFT